jgi:hypothetical protein
MTDRVRITVTENGPLSRRGPLPLVDQDGDEYDIAGRKPPSPSTSPGSAHAEARSSSRLSAARARSSARRA